MLDIRGHFKDLKMLELFAKKAPPKKFQRPISRRNTGWRGKLGKLLPSALDMTGKLIPIVLTIGTTYVSYVQYEKFREGGQKLDVEIKPRVESDPRPMLVVDVILKNIGKVAIWAKNTSKNPPTVDSKGKKTYYDCDGKRVENGHQGLELTIIEYQSMKSAPDKAEERRGAIEWNAGMEDGVDYHLATSSFNIISGHAFNQCTYMLNPGTTTRESAVIPVKAGKLYAILARFFSDDGWTEKDITYVMVPSASAASGPAAAATWADQRAERARGSVVSAR